MKIIAVVMLFLMTTAAGAATLESKDAAKKLTDQVMAKVASGDIEGGLILMKPYTIIPESEFNVMLEQTKLQLPIMQGRFGKILGAEFIKEMTVGKSLLKIVQIQKFEKHIMRWSFIFYSPDGKWVLNSFNFDDNIRSMFEE
jgi:nucleoside recognition membrane protein YjiH